ncbi:MAG: sulfatase-like hydrolase/transferase [Edaphobacter sp.]|uniref:sulfatase-like hydrolase/transferase n=1 Tax=Edaphobacter sp. TaxID=1934404 RepID=UPI0023A0E9EE|nr:sulfatase-like hydrolase/transferase [Edaphobacter sp.]MDE1175679.1 sulfatase-like hydrolase/transferase [Edaphobacter sp.]
MSNETTRRSLLKSAALAGLATLTGGAAETASAQDNKAPAPKIAWKAPAAQSGNNLNLIVLVSDTFRADNLEAYGSQWVQTPHLNAFAKEAVLFEHVYPEGMPTIPIRRQLYTGRRILPTHLYFQQDTVTIPGWHQLFIEDVTLSETLRAANYKTALIADLPHLFKPDRNFHRGFGSFQWIRGQEIDALGTPGRTPLDLSPYYPAEYIDRVQEAKQFARGQQFSKFLEQYTANRKEWTKNGDSIVQQTAKTAINWLEENHASGPFYLQVEAFDPHEPWDPPQQFLEKYLKEPTKHSWPEPPYGDVKVPEEGVKRLRANYAGEASNVDYWYGQVLEKIKQLGLYDNSIIVFLADHGALLNEQNQWVKGPEKLRKQVTHVPFLVRLPKGEHGGKRISGFAQTPDVVPTLLGRLNLKPSERVTGEDLWTYVDGGKQNNREYAVSAYGWIASIRTHEWNYSAVWNPSRYTGNYTPQLYDVQKDPEELHNVADQHPAVLKELQSKLDAYIESGRHLTNGSFSQEL